MRAVILALGFMVTACAWKEVPEREFLVQKAYCSKVEQLCAKEAFYVSLGDQRSSNALANDCLIIAQSWFDRKGYGNLDVFEACVSESSTCSELSNCSTMVCINSALH